MPRSPRLARQCASHSPTTARSFNPELIRRADYKPRLNPLTFATNGPGLRDRATLSFPVITTVPLNATAGAGRRHVWVHRDRRIIYPLRDVQPAGHCAHDGGVGIAAVLRSMRVRGSGPTSWPRAASPGRRSLRRIPSGLRAAADPAVPAARAAIPASSSTRGPTPSDALNRRAGGAPIRADRAVLLRAGECRRAVPRAQGEHLGGAVQRLIGKPIGILVAVAIAVTAGFHLPQRVGWRDLIVAGFIVSARLHRGALLRDRHDGAGSDAAVEDDDGCVAHRLMSIEAAFAATRVLRVGRFARQ